MARPLRIEFPGAIYHVTSRGDRREPIFIDDHDRRTLLSVLEQTLQRCDARMLAYCLMGNHYHFVLRTDRGNLSRVMRQVNGVYTQLFNTRHGIVGHLFQGRFKAILVDGDAYLLEVCRYVELNPVRAGMVRQPGEWPWSSHLAHVGRATSPRWLDSNHLLSHLLGRDVQGEMDILAARHAYAELVLGGLNTPLWDSVLRQQIFLGDDAFVERMQAKARPDQRASTDIPSQQRRSPTTLAHWLQSRPTISEALRDAHQHGGLTMTSMARSLGMSVSRVSRLVRAAELKHSTVDDAKGKT